MKSKNEFTGEETERFWKFIEGDDLDFYEQNLLNQPEEVQRHLLEQHPDFLSEYHFDPLQENGINLLQDEILRGIMVRKKYLKQPGD